MSRDLEASPESLCCHREQGSDPRAPVLKCGPFLGAWLAGLLEKLKRT